MKDASLLSYGVLIRISPGYSPVTGRLHTCYAPVRRSHTILLPYLPLDLHVLGLPLAFILSQDQTLHCKRMFDFLDLFLNFRNTQSIPEARYSQFLKELYNLLVTEGYILIFCSLLLNFRSERGCKGKQLFQLVKNFRKNSESFFGLAQLLIASLSPCSRFTFFRLACFRTGLQR